MDKEDGARNSEPSSQWNDARDTTDNQYTKLEIKVKVKRCLCA
jgi:hypothetical protein